MTTSNASGSGTLSTRSTTGHFAIASASPQSSPSMTSARSEWPTK
jgi:hypothetical protein